ncbi:MAG: molybdopterin-dependent oxidoreductase [Desulfovibrio sp.]|jgi:anaerobic selenocysteine-containing dehydrogenase|nr:molybdopterin-dependent oxidoreductase [Desulfovibrio sp.]
MQRLSACSLDCHGACSLVVHLPDEEMSVHDHPAGGVRVSGNPDHPFTRGVVCVKGRGLAARRLSPDRITTPLVRGADGELHPATWDEALALCASKLDALRDTPEAILHLRGFGYRGALAEASNYLFNSLGAARKRGSLCDGAGDAACEADFGTPDHNDSDDLANAAAIVNWGKDLARSSLHLGLMVRDARKRGVPVLTISPGGDDNDAFTDARIRIRPGGDRFLAAAAIRRLLTDDAVPPAISGRTRGFEQFRAMLLAHSEAELLAACDATTEDLDTLCRWMRRQAGNGGPTASLLGWGLQRYLRGGESVRFVNALVMLSGNMGVSGGGAYYGISSGRSLDLSWSKKAGTPARTFLLSHLAQELARADPPVRFLWVDAFNPVNQSPDAPALARAVEAIDFTVVVEAFLTDTARRADVVLPCALVMEREEIFGSAYHNYIAYAAPACPMPGQVRHDFDIARGVAERLARPIPFPEREEVLRQALRSPYLEVSLEELKTAGWAKAKRPSVAWEGLRFAHPDGLYHLPEALHLDGTAVAASDAASPADYPLHLLTLLAPDYVNSQVSLPARQPADNAAPVTVQVAPECPALPALDLDRPVFLASPHGRMLVQVQTLPGLHPRTVIMPRGGWLAHGRSPNALIAPLSTDMGDGAAYYEQRVRLEN